MNNERKKGGYAYYIGCKVGSIKHSGRIGYDVVDPNMAEIQCILNALKALRDDRTFRPITKVWVFSDSQLAIDALSDKPGIFSTKNKIYPMVREARFLMMEISLKHASSIRKVDTFFEFKKVKAHTNGKDIYSKINQWCDIEARKRMREQN